MTFAELKKRLNEDFGINTVPDYMKGVDFVLLCLAKPLWAIEYGQEKELFRSALFDLMVNLPNSRYWQMFGPRYLELFQRALAESQRPLTHFLRNARALARQHAGMLDLDAYRAALAEDIQ